MVAVDTYQKSNTDSILWVGGKDSMDRELLKDYEIPFMGISAAGLHGVGFKNLPGNAIELLKGYSQSREILKHFQPDVLFFTGGYVAVPMALAGMRYPSLLYVPDIEPGMALKTLAIFADWIDVTTEQTCAYFRDQSKISVTGYPTRPELHLWEQETAYKTMDLDPNLLTLLVMGGSRGARSINRAVMNYLPELLEDYQIIHISGKLDWPEVLSMSETLESRTPHVDRYHPYDFLHKEIGAALTAADLVVSRAGASVIGEYPIFGLPAILVPYPYAWQYQEVNAQYLSDQGAAVVLHDEEIGEKLLDQVRELFSDRDRLEILSQSMQELISTGAAEKIAFHLREIAGGSGRD